MRFQVHSCTRDTVAVTAEFGGRQVEATVHGLVVELVSEDGRSSQTLRYLPDDIEADEAKFEVGAFVTATYEKEV